MISLILIFFHDLRVFSHPIFRSPVKRNPTDLQKTTLLVIRPFAADRIEALPTSRHGTDFEGRTQNTHLTQAAVNNLRGFLL